VANDDVCVVNSNAASTYTAVPNTFTAITAGTSTSNSEYQDAQIDSTDDGMSVRVVSSELRLRYIDTELNRGGQIVALMDPSHGSLGGRDIPAFDAQETSRRFPVSRDWLRVLYRPVDSADLDFQEDIPTADLSDGAHQFYMGFVIQAPASAAVTYEWEFHTTFEAFGKNIRAMTPSHVDSLGFGAVHAVSNLGVNLYPTNQPAPATAQAMVADTAKYLSSQTSHVTSVSPSQSQQVTSTGRSKTQTVGDVLHTVGDAAYLGATLLDWFF
jgi:hypothetical protein